MTTRTEPAGLVVRTITSADLTRQKAGDTMTFDAIGVPWDTIIDHQFGAEQFDRGSVELHPNGTKILTEHRDVVGRVTAADDTDTGYRVTGQLSDTTAGRDLWTLMQDGVIDRMSIGFEPHEYRFDETDVLHWTRVTAREFSLVAFPAYDDTPVTNLRTATRTPTQQEPPMPATADLVTRDEFTSLDQTVTDLFRQINAAGGAPDPGHAPQWRTIGAFLQAIARGDDDAAEFHRAYTGGTTADSVFNETFLGGFITLVQDHRRLTSLFGRQTLPASGMSLDYYQLDTDTTQVGKQTNEGDDLLKGKVTLKKANSQISTYGGWTELSRQEVERAPLPILDTILRALGLRYGATVEAATRAVFSAQVTTNLGGANNIPLGATLAAGTVDQWLNGLIDAGDKLDALGFTPDGMIVSKSVFKRLVGLTDAGNRRLMNVYGDPAGNAIGRAELAKLTGNLAGTTVHCVPSLAGDVATVYDPVAIDLYESAGAPAQLQDENIINLSKSYSVYGYAAHVIPFPTAILPIKFS